MLESVGHMVQVPSKHFEKLLFNLQILLLAYEKVSQIEL